MKYKSVKKPNKCPKCESHIIADILYGLPVFNLAWRKRLMKIKLPWEAVVYPDMIPHGSALIVIQLISKWR